MFGYKIRPEIEWYSREFLPYIIIILTMPRHNDSMTFVIIIKLSSSIVQISCRVFNEIRWWRCRIVIAVWSSPGHSSDSDFISSTAQQRVLLRVVRIVWFFFSFFIIITSANVQLSSVSPRTISSEKLGKLLIFLLSSSFTPRNNLSPEYLFSFPFLLFSPGFSAFDTDGTFLSSLTHSHNT